ncbi:MAG: HgcAB-associated protein [Desulfobacterales bacterium]
MKDRPETGGESVLSGCGPACCQIEAIVGVDEKGQMVLPKAVRDRAGIRAGDKLALIGWQKGGEICCLGLIKAESLAEMVKGWLGPLMKELAE